MCKLEPARIIEDSIGTSKELTGRADSDHWKRIMTNLLNMMIDAIRDERLEKVGPEELRCPVEWGERGGGGEDQQKETEMNKKKERATDGRERKTMRACSKSINKAGTN